MTDYQPVDCGDYDFLEIACMDRYDVELRLGVESDAGPCRAGRAHRLETLAGEETLWLTDESGEEHAIRIDRILSITVLTRPSRFEFHAFTRSP